MPLGETIGTAYVRVLADGTGFAEDVKRQFRRAAPEFDRLGSDMSDAYLRGWNSTFQDPDNDPLESLEDALQHGLGRWDAVGEMLGDHFMDGLRDELEARFPGVSDVVLQNLRDDLAKGDLGEQGLLNRLHNIRREVARAAQDIGKEQSKAFDELAASVKRFGDGIDRNGPSRKHLLDDLRRLRDTLPHTVRDSEEFRAKWRDVTRALGDAAPKMKRFKDSLEGAGGRISRFFGRGSRNDFLNFFGGMVGGIAKATQALMTFYKWPGLVAEQFQKLTTKFKNAVDQAGSLGGALSELASAGLPGLIAAVATVAVLVKVLGSLMGAFASAIVLLTGLILALAGSLAFALVGGLTAVAGALVPFAAALGVAAIAMTKLDKKSKFFKDLKADWRDLQKTAQTAIFGKDLGGLKNLSSVLNAVKPLIEDVGHAIGNLLEDLGKAARSKGFKDMISGIGDAIGPMIEKLGSITGNIATFFGEAFLAAKPIINEFLSWLDGVTGKLAAFGKPGKGGKSGLSKFFEDAWVSAKKVGKLIENIILIIGDLFGAGKEHGDSIIDKLAKSAEDLHKWLSDPKNADALEQWFSDAEKLGDKIGDIVDDVLRLIDTLDTPTNRTILFGLLTVADKLIVALSKIAGFMDTINRGNLLNISDAISGISDFFGSIDIGQAWSDLWASFDPLGAISDFLDSIDISGSIEALFDSIDISGAIDGLKQPFIDFWNWLVGHSLIPDLIAEIVRLFGELPGKIITAIGSLPSVFAGWVAQVPAAIGGVILSLSLAFGGLAQKMIAKAGSIATAFGTWVAGLPGKARGAVTTIVTAFSGLAQKIISKAGSIASAFGGWVAGLAGKARSTAVSIISAFAGLAQKIISRAGSIASAFGSWLAGLPGKARQIANQIAQGFAGLAGKMIAKAGDIVSKVGAWARGAVTAAGRVATGIVGEFRGLAGRIVEAIGTIVPKIKMPNITRPVVDAIVKVKGNAAGAIYNQPTVGLFAEAGPEAIVPLNRPLSQIDPAVRMLSAIAQGKVRLGGGDNKPGKTIDIGGITINTPTEDPRAVASEVVAHMAAAAYI